MSLILNNRIETLVKILKAQDELLDCMLAEQKEIHDMVKERNWNKLEDKICRFDAFSNAFVELDENREKLVGQDRELYLEKEVEPYFVNVRTKLSRSKIENEALKIYVNTTQEFISGVIEECVPQNRNTLYNPYGQIVKPEVSSVVVNSVI